MSFHPTMKSGRGSIGSLPQSKQSSIIPFPGVSPAEDAPTPTPVAPAPKAESKIDLFNTLLTANYDVEYECYMEIFYAGVTGYSLPVIYDLLDVPETEASPFAYMGHVARLYMALAFEMVRYEVSQLNRPMELDEIYAVCEKNAAIAGNQARMMSRIMHIDLLSGESLEG
jgi:hypothetical protein